MLCSNCSFGSKKDNCTKCDKWMGGNKTPAVICSNCSFGSKKDNCSKCKNGWVIIRHLVTCAQIVGLEVKKIIIFLLASRKTFKMLN